jgi:alkanesulfonate monooxygenase SsuD/methylene tetrahydromethanopterin reductase-like flavin-dependent oxidoreductase (luciferase family)
MRIGLALPQYDYSVAGEPQLRWDTLASYARLAESRGLDSLWLSDHVFFDVGKYGGPPDHVGVYDPIVTLAALARVTTSVRLGTLVVCEALRPASVLVKGLTAIDRLSGGRLEVGLGAGWYEPEYEAIGMPLPPRGERMQRLRDAIVVCDELLGGGPSSHAGRWHATAGAVNAPAALQRPRPPVFVGGKGDRLLGIVAELADGWNTCWSWTPDAYRKRAAVLDRACEALGRDPATVHRSLGLYALCGEDERDLRRRFDRLVSTMPPGVMSGWTVEEWRSGRLVGTPEQIHEQVDGWKQLGVEEVVLGVGAVPFAVTAPDDVELLAETLVGAP